jgi:hypothetical protein
MADLTVFVNDTPSDGAAVYANDAELEQRINTVAGFFIPSGGIDGLDVTIGEGVLPDGSVRAAQTITLVAGDGVTDADNYVQKDPVTGDVSLGDGDFDGGNDPLYYFTTDEASITNLDQTSGANRYDRRSLSGPVGATGATGAAGANGQGVPVGGTTGQILEKASGTDYDTQWTAKYKAPFALTDASSIAVSPADGFIQDVTLTGNHTLANWTSPADGDMILFRIRQDGTGSRTLTPDTNYRDPRSLLSAGDFALSTAAGALNYIFVIYDATDGKFDILDFA